MENEELLERYEDLARRFRDFKEESENTEVRLLTELEEKNREVGQLEPYKKKYNASYDNYISNGGGDECFKNGMRGKCGKECSVYGSQEECFDGIGLEELLEIYKNEELEDLYYLEMAIDKNGGKKEKLKIEIQLLKADKVTLVEKINKIDEEILQINDERKAIAKK